MPRHPNEALFEGEKMYPILPTCEHFAGTEVRVLKAFELQGKMGGVFDITCLLYTSPSPRDGLLSRMPSSA